MNIAAAAAANGYKPNQRKMRHIEIFKLTIIYNFISFKI